MSQLRIIYELLREEYALSCHIWWLDEESGKLVNDVVLTLMLIRQAAECLRLGEEDCWQVLVTYALERSMSYRLMHAIGEYLMTCGELTPLPIIDLTPDKYRNWQGSILPLLEESDPAFIHAATEKPEPDRDMVFKSDHRWSDYPWRTRDEHPQPETQTVSKSIHWLFA